MSRALRSTGWLGVSQVSLFGWTTGYERRERRLERQFGARRGVGWWFNVKDLMPDTELVVIGDDEMLPKQL